MRMLRASLYSVFIAVAVISLLIAASPHAPAFSQETNAPASLPAQNVPVSAEDAKIYLEGCLAKIPRRFTPQAHETYCTCTAAALRGTITAAEYAQIRAPKNQKPGNLAFEKYVTNVIMPCMEYPVQDIVYLECVLNRSNDPRISNIPSFCQCMANQASDYVKKFGNIDAMLLLGNKFDRIKDPAQAMINSGGFANQKQKALSECLDLRFR